MSFFDSHSRPLPRFYDLTIERRAEAIADERGAVALRRYKLGKREFFCEIARLSYMDDSVGLLDVVAGKKSHEIYRRILLGD